MFLSFNEYRRKHKRVLRAIVAGGTLAVALAVVGTALQATPAIPTAQSASAHTADLTVTAKCNKDTGQYDQSAALVLDKVPAGETGTVVWHEGTTSFVNNWNGGSFTFEGNAGQHFGNGTVQITGLPSLPGTTTGNGPWLYVYTTFDNGDTFTIKSDNYPGNPNPLKGDCVKPDAKDASVSISQTNASCSANGAASWANPQNVVTPLPTLDQTPGVHTPPVVTATSGHVFADGSKTYQAPDYTIQVQKDDLSCHPPQTCTVVGPSYAENRLAEVTADGDLYKGDGSTSAQRYWPVTGNLQGLGTQSMTFKDVHGYQPSMTFVFNPNGAIPTTAGGSGVVLHYANLVAEWANGNGGQPDTDGTFTVDPATTKFWMNKIANGAGPVYNPGSQNNPQPLSFFTNLLPDNSFTPNTGAGAIGGHLGSTATSDTHSLVTAFTGCVNVSTVPVPPTPQKQDIEQCSTNNDGQGVIQHQEMDAIFVDGKYTFDGATWKTVSTSPAPAGDCAVTFTECEAQTTLPTATPSNPLGWGDVLNGTWVPNGIDLKATSSEEAYAYVDLDVAHQFKFSDIGSLSTVQTIIHGGSAIIMQATGGQNIHVEADGTYWTIHPGLFPETAPGYYSTTNPWAAGQTYSNPTITEVAVWVNPGDEVVLHTQSYHCLTQPFDVDRATAPAPTPSQVCTAGSTVNTVNLPNTTLATYVTTWNGDHMVATTVGTPTANNGFVKGDGYTLNENGTATWVFTFPSAVCLSTLAVTGVTITEASVVGGVALLLGLLAKFVLVPYLRRRRASQA